MDVDFPRVDERDAEAALRQTITSLRLALSDFEKLVERFRQFDETATDTELGKSVRRLREAFTGLNKERQTFERELNGRNGAFGAAPLDLASARAEVGRLLDCLRADGRAGGVSVEPEP